MSGKDPSVLLLEHHLKALKLPTVGRVAQASFFRKQVG